MDCRLFHHWIENRDIYDVSETDKARKHVAQCVNCQELLTKEEQLDTAIIKALGKQEIPQRLRNSIDLNLDQPRSETKRFNLWWTAAPALLASIILLYLVLPFSYGVRTIDELGQYSLADHSSHSVQAAELTEINKLTTWCQGKVDFKAVRPNIESQGYQFLGGRICSLGQFPAVHLMYKKGDRVASVYIIDEKVIRFPLPNRGEKALLLDGQQLRIWKRNNLVYTLVG